nr:MAG TPA: hypothetical protein [Caudoviricetes sp.]
MLKEYKYMSLLLKWQEPRKFFLIKQDKGAAR